MNNTKTTANIQKTIVSEFQAQSYVANDDGTLYHWNGSYYAPQASNLVYREIVSAFFSNDLAAKDKECEAYARGCLSQLANLSWRTSFDSDSEDLISFTNGTISRSQVLEGKQTAPVAPTADKFCTYSLAVSWKPSASHAPVYDYLLPMFGDSMERLEEYGRFAKAVLLGDVSHGRALFLYGGPGTGKSTLANILSMLVPTEHISSVGIDQLGADNAEYYLAELQHSLLNIGGEISKPNHKAARMIKQLTGGDRVIARPIRQQPVKFINRANLLFFANETFGRGGDNSGAMDDRIRVLEVNRRTRDTSTQVVNFAGWFMQNHSEAFVAWAMSLQGAFGKSSIYKQDNKTGMDSDQYLEFAKEFLAPEGMCLSEILEVFRKTQGYSVTSEKMAKELKRLGWEAGKQQRVPGLGRQRLYSAPENFFTPEDKPQVAKPVAAPKEDPMAIHRYLYGPKSTEPVSVPVSVDNRDTTETPTETPSTPVSVPVSVLSQSRTETPTETHPQTVTIATDYKPTTLGKKVTIPALEAFRKSSDYTPAPDARTHTWR